MILFLVLCLTCIWDCHAKKDITPKQITLPYSGLTIEYATHGKKSSHDIPIIAIHGFPASWYSYYLLMKAMPKQLIYAVSLPCYGGSTKDEDIARDLDSQAGIIKEFMDELDIESAYIMGHSMGSIIAPRVGLLYPDRVKGIITAGTVGSGALNPDIVGLMESLIETAIEQFNLSPDDPFPLDYIKNFLNPISLGLLPEFYFNKSAEEVAKVPSKCWQAGLSAMKNTNQIDDLKNLEKPFLIIHGAKDIIAWDAEKGGVESVILNVPDVTLYKLHNLGHAPHQEDPEKSAEIIKSFLKYNKK